MSHWDEYLAAAVRLDDVRRESAATVAAQHAASGAVAADLSGVRQRIALQRTRLTEIAAGVNRTTPPVEPLDAERVTAQAVLASAAPSVATPTGDRTPGIAAALKGVRAALDAADATLSAATDRSGQRGVLASRRPGVRNAIVYGWFAVVALVAVVEINAVVGGSVQAGVLVALFSLLVPAGAWMLGWVTLLLLFGRGAGSGSSDGARGPASTAYRPSGAVVGAVLCAVPACVGLILSVV